MSGFRALEAIVILVVSFVAYYSFEVFIGNTLGSLPYYLSQISVPMSGEWIYIIGNWYEHFGYFSKIWGILCLATLIYAVRVIVFDHGYSREDQNY